MERDIVLYCGVELTHFAPLLFRANTHSYRINVILD